MTRLTVQRHLTDCPECVFIVGETSRYLSSANEEEAAEAEEDAPRFRRWRPALAAAAMAVVCLLGAWHVAARRDPLQRLRQLTAATPVRGIEGRLDGFPHRRYSAVRSNVVRTDPTLRIEAERVIRLDREDGRGWQARGVAALLLGRADQAIAMLRKAVDLEPGNASYWSDLAAAHLAAAEDPAGVHLKAAITASERAITLAPSLESGHFNHALALERSGDRVGAAKAWTRFLDLDRQSAWSREAADRHNSLFH